MTDTSENNNLYNRYNGFTIIIIFTYFYINDKKPAIIYALHLVQKENNYLKSSHIDAVANLLNLKKIDVHEVASFYSMFELEKIGKNTISVCTNVSDDEFSDTYCKIEKKLNIKVGRW